MKKQYLLILIVALILCLTGCGECQHEWTEADCLTAKTCTQCGIIEGDALGHDFAEADCENPEVCVRCGETEGQALGHSWKVASCTAPETCTRCGITQGEALPHSFGKWRIPGGSMERDCVVCGFVETADIDREVFAWEHIIGHWDPYVVSEGGSSYWANILGEKSVIYCLQVHEDRTVRLELGDTVYEGTVSFDRVDESSDTVYYIFAADLGDDLQVEFLYMEVEGEEQVLLSFGTDYVVFSQYNLIREFAQGTWASGDDGEIYTLTLQEDGTFEDSERHTGIWHIRPVTLDGGWREQLILLSCAAEEMLYAGRLNLSLGGEETSLEDYLSYDPDILSYLNMDNDFKNLEKLDPEELKKMEEGLKEGNEKILGTWNSNSVNIYKNDSSWDQIALQYSVSFREDGTFTAQLDTEKTGTWSLRDVSMGQYGVEYSYDIRFDDRPEAYDYCYYGEYEGLRLTLSGGDSSVHYYFRQPDDPLIAEGRKKILGDWASCNTTMWDDGSNHTMSRFETGNTITFHEDGTCVVNMGEEKSGTWVVCDAQRDEWEDGTASNRFDYLFQLDGEEKAIRASCANDLLLNIFEQSGRGYRSKYEFCKYSQEELREIQKNIAGNWTSVKENKLDNSVGHYVEKPNTDYTMTVNEDGTFQMFADMEITGTWELVLYYRPADNGLFFNFHRNDSEYIISCTLHEDDSMTVGVDTDSEHLIIFFEKN